MSVIKLTYGQRNGNIDKSIGIDQFNAEQRGPIVNGLVLHVWIC